MKKIVPLFLLVLILAGVVVFQLRPAPVPEIAPPAAPVAKSAPAPEEAVAPPITKLAEPTPEKEDVSSHEEKAKKIVFQGVVLTADGTPVKGAVIRFGVPGFMDAAMDQMKKAMEKAVPDAAPGTKKKHKSSHSQKKGDSPEKENANANPFQNASTKTDNDGAYTLAADTESTELILGSLVCEAPGFARVSKSLHDIDGVKTAEQVRMDFVLQPGARIFGHVTRGDNGATLADAKINLRVKPKDLGSRFDTSHDNDLDVKSGADGSYEITVSPASYTVRATTEQRDFIAPKGSIPPVTVNTGQERQLDIVLQPSAVVVGSITADGKPVGGDSVFVDVSRDFSGASPFDFTDRIDGGADFNTISVSDKGHYSDNGLEYGMPYTVTVNADGYAEFKSASFSVQPGQSPFTVDVALSSGSAIRGTVKYEDGTPAATVSLILLDTKAGTPIYSAKHGPDGENKSDQNGAFAIEHVGAGEYKVTDEKSMFDNFNPMKPKAAAEEPITVDGVHDVDKVEMILHRPAPGAAGSITGRVLDAAGAPVKGVSVFAHAAAPGQFVPDRSEPTETADDGTFKIDGLTADSYSVSARQKDAKAEQEEVAPGSDITLVLQTQAKVSGTVVDSAGNPVAQCKVTLVKKTKEATEGFDPAAFMGSFGGRGSKDATNESGGFEISSVEAGRYVIKATSVESGAGESEPFEIADGENKTGINVKLKPGILFSGHVLDAKGAPVLGARVGIALVPEGGNPMTAMMSNFMPEEMQSADFEAHTADDGGFEFRNVTPGTYKLSASAEGYALKKDPAVKLPVGHDVTGYKIVLGQGGCISGKAIHHGESSAGMMVEVLGEGGDKMAQTADDGQFEVCGLSAGSYTVMVMNPRAMIGGDMSSMTPTMRKAEVKDGETVEVDFSPVEGSTTVQGTVAGSTGKMVSLSLRPPGAAPATASPMDMMAQLDAAGSLGGQAIVAPDGSFSIADVAPGDYVLEIYAMTFDPQHMNMTEIMSHPPKPVVQQNIRVVAGQPLTLQFSLPEAPEDAATAPAPPETPAPETAAPVEEAPANP